MTYKTKAMVEGYLNDSSIDVGHKGICASILNDSKRQMELYHSDSKTTT